MKKLGKSLSFLTKIMLVVGLLISNLSSLSIVFASEVTIDVSVVEDKLSIKYLKELADDVEKVRVNVYESYTYLDDTPYEDEITSQRVIKSSSNLSFVDEDIESDENSNVQVEDVEVEITEDVVVEDTPVVDVDETTNTEFTENEEVNNDVEDIQVEGVEIEEIEVENTGVENTENVEVSTNTDKKIELVVDTILSNVVFDGRYDVTVEIVNTTDGSNGEVIDTRDFSMDVLHDSGIELSVVDAVTGEELNVLENGKYAIDYTNPKVNVVAKVLAGGLKPNDIFLYNNQYEYRATELVELGFTSEFDFSGRLYGEYTIPSKIVLSKYNIDTQLYEEVVIDEENLNVDVLYGTYELNALAMNVAAMELELNESYVFDGNTDNGVVYVLLNENTNNTMLDLYNIANYMFEEDEYITYLLSNNKYEDVLSTYDETTATVSLEEYLASIKLDDTAVLSLVNDGLTVMYRVIVAGDMNNDDVLTEDDLLDLVNQVIGEKNVNLEKSNLYGLDEEINTLDVMYLDQVIENGTWMVTLNEELDVTFDSELRVTEDDIISGQKFTVDYIVKLSDYMINGVSGLFTYDEDALELNFVETANEWLGNSSEGKFLYIGEESLELPVIEDTKDDEIVTDIPVVDEEVVENTDVENEDMQPADEVVEEVITEDYVVVTATFTAKKAGTHTISVENQEFFNHNTYYGTEDTPISTVVVVNASNNNNLSTLTVAGQIITLVEGQLDYEITVSNDIDSVEVMAMVENVAANITSIVSPEELVEGENIITVTVTAENGDIKVYTVKVIRETAPEDETTTQVSYDSHYDDTAEEEVEEEKVVTEPDEEIDEDIEKEEEESSLSRIVIIILILLVIAGLIYLIFKDEDDNETKKINKEVKKLEKEVKEPEIKREEKINNKSNSNNNKNSKNNSKNNKRK